MTKKGRSQGLKIGNRRLRGFVVFAALLPIVAAFAITSVYLTMKQSKAAVNGELTTFVQLSAGHRHTCAIASDNKAYCWGQNTYGQLGNGTTSNSSTPVAVSTSGVLAGKTIKQISSSGYHSCAIASDDKVYCWGFNNRGQLGDGTTTNSNVPVAVNTSGALAGKIISQLSANGYHTCAIDSDGKAYCWGLGLSGQLGQGTATDSSVPVAVNTSGVLAGKTIKQLSAKDYHTCAVASDDKAYCWGFNNVGQLGNNTTTNSSVPVAVNTSGVLAGKTIKQISANDYHTCAVDSDGKAYCWGRNDYGQLGTGTTTNSSVPVAASVSTSGVLAGKTIKQVFADGYRTCVIASDDKAYCWGHNNYGQLGNGTTTDSSVPVAVDTSGALAGKTIEQYSSGLFHACVIASDSKAYCWAYNNVGQLGNGTTTNSSVPVVVSPIQLNSVNVDQDISRIYESSTTTLPGMALASTNAVATLPSIGSSFRVRVGIKNTSPAGNTILGSSIKLRAQYAKKGTAATCSAVPDSSWQNITASSSLAYASIGPANGTAISAYSDDPVLPSITDKYSYQSIVRVTGADSLTFINNNSIKHEETGLWDLALTDSTLERGTNYCVRLVTDTAAAPGTSIDVYSQYPEFKTSDGTLDIRFADAANTTLTNPTTSFTPAATSNTVATTTAQLSNNSSQQLEVSNTLSMTGWNVTLAPTAGTGAKWEQSGGSANYGFNSTNTADGQLSVDLSAGTFAVSGTTPAGQACTTSGLSFGAGGAFVTGTPTAGAITLASASSASGLNCIFKLQNISLRQTIPAFQTPGTYTLPVTATVTAQ